MDWVGAESPPAGHAGGTTTSVSTAIIKSPPHLQTRQKLAQRATTRRATTRAASAPDGVAGLRNRASALAAMFGRKLTPAEVQDADTWGDETIGKAKEGWCVRRNGPLYQLYIIRKIGPLCLRVHYGHKLNHARIWGRPAMVVNISLA